MIIKALIATRIWLSSTTLNPVKISFALFLIRTLFLTRASLTTGHTWAPLIFYMLFTGGILVIFIILSSNMPNEKVMKVKVYPLAVIVIISAPIAIITERISTPILIKLMPQNARTIPILSIIVLIYFFSFIKFLKEFKSPIRTTVCQN